MCYMPLTWKTAVANKFLIDFVETIIFKARTDAAITARMQIGQRQVCFEELLGDKSLLITFRQPVHH